MKISIHFRNFYQVFSVVASLSLNLGEKSAQNCNADVSGPYREKLYRATANQGARFLKISDREKIKFCIERKLNWALLPRNYYQALSLAIGL